MMKGFFKQMQPPIFNIILLFKDMLTIGGVFMSKRQNEGKQDQVLDNLVRGENEPLSEKERQNNKKKKNNQ